MSPEDQRAHDIVQKLFKNDYGQPFDMTPGQTQLFRAIYERQHPRTQFECYTQYGKSDVVSMAVLMRVATFQEKWIILGATKDKAGIIMSKLIKHIFENDYTLGKFEVAEGENLDYIRRSRSKDNITFKVDDNAIGNVITLSADARRRGDDAGDILIGHGAQNLIEDDAALIPDAIHGKALRMLGGHRDNFLLKITNTFGRNHAYRSSIDPKTNKIVIDWQQGVREGRITDEFINEMRASLDPVMFGILYDCVYPPSNLVDEQGWMPLLVEEDILNAQARKVESKGYKRLGLDVSEGTNYNAYVIRTDNYAFVKEKSTEKDLMKTADRFCAVMGEERVHDSHAFVDAIGVGAGVSARAKQMGKNVNAVKSGEKPTERKEADKIANPIEFMNLRAELNWKMKEWIRQGGALETSKEWMQLTKLRYRETPNGKIQIMTKEEMRARGLLGMTESTDVPDALALTFAPVDFRFIEQPKASEAVKPYYPDIDGSGVVPVPTTQGPQKFGGASPISSSGPI